MSSVLMLELVIADRGRGSSKVREVVDADRILGALPSNGAGAKAVVELLPLEPDATVGVG